MDSDPDSQKRLIEGYTEGGRGEKEGTQNINEWIPNSGPQKKINRGLKRRAEEEQNTKTDETKKYEWTNAKLWSGKDYRRTWGMKEVKVVWK